VGSASCPTCLEALADERRLCARCRTPYHPRCFDESRCLVTGCEPLPEEKPRGGVLWLIADMAWIALMAVEAFCICGARRRSDLSQLIREELLFVANAAMGLTAGAALVDLLRGRRLTSPACWGWLALGIAVAIMTSVKSPSAMGGLAGPLVYGLLWMSGLLGLAALAFEGRRDQLRVFVVVLIALPAFVYALTSGDVR
jgi:hypothetical protein